MAELKKKATRESYGEALAELGDKYDNLYVFDADLAAATKTGIFKKKFPDRFFDCGIAESNMMGVAAGMAATSIRAGKKLYRLSSPQCEDRCNTRRYLCRRRRCNTSVQRGYRSYENYPWHGGNKPC